MALIRGTLHRYTTVAASPCFITVNDAKDKILHEMLELRVIELLNLPQVTFLKTVLCA